LYGDRARAYDLTEVLQSNIFNFTMKSTRNTLLKGALTLAALALALSFAACSRQSAAKAKKSIVVTYSILGSVVQDLVGDSCTVTVSIPNGMDLHEWEPSAKDIEALTKADLIVQNGLGLEEGMEGALEQARKAGVRIFTASDCITPRIVGQGEGIPSDDPDQQVGAKDPHLWTDPLAMKAIVLGLSQAIKTDLGIKLGDRAETIIKELDGLDADIRAKVDTLPADKRALVTGHESMGYFAQQYGFKLVGAIVPSLSTQAEVSASELANLKKKMIQNKADVIFTEIGTPAAVVKTLASELKVKAVPLATHSLGEDGKYSSYLRLLADTVIDNLD
jgi:zinc/manganese transport system substrate-binding protein